MLTSLHVQHFQALHDVTLELSPLTVIVGASSSGKSALTRALHTVTHNRRGTEWITHGEQSSSITATTATHAVTLTRTIKPGDGNAYVLTRLDDETSERFTKLGAAVPVEVSRALGITPDGINFAGQHDMPFMLATTGSSNAQALGRLTNVHTIFDAAREANRQRAQSSSTLRMRMEDLDGIKASIVRFKNLSHQRAAVERAEDALKWAHMTSSKLDRLRYLIEALQVTSRAIPAMQRAAARTLPTLTSAEQASSSLDRFHSLRGQLINTMTETQHAQANLHAAGVTVDMLTERRAGLMSNLAADIEQHMRTADETAETIRIPEAARISAEYIRDLT
jgi:DNA repair ATPase RecN